jgi:hypothetical protein
MRAAINENRTVQIALLALLALAGGFMFLKMTHGGASQASTTSSSTGATTTATADTGGVSATAAPISGTGSAAAPGAAPPIPANMVPGSGAPKSLLAAYKKGDAVALLVVRAGGSDDALVHGSLGRLNAIPRLAVYVTKAKGIARFAWLTQGVDVTDLPALVLLRPRGLSKGAPTASVSYGFRDGQSVQQAAKDALYRGPNHLPYHP